MDYPTSQTVVEAPINEIERLQRGGGGAGWLEGPRTRRSAGQRREDGRFGATLTQEWRDGDSVRKIGHQKEARSKWYVFEKFLVRALRVEVNEEKIQAKNESQKSRSEW